MEKVTWRRTESGVCEPYMFEKYMGIYIWIHYKQSVCYSPDYKPFLNGESKGMGAFRTAIKLGYEVVKDGK